MKTHARTLVPRLIVKGAKRAVAFYQQALGAKLDEIYVDNKRGDFVVHAALSIGDAKLMLAEEHPEWLNQAPTSLGGTPVILSLDVDDAVAVGARMEAAGATVVFPIKDQFYGYREGRLRDPFGHLWILSQKVRDMTPEEIQRGVDDFE